MKHAVTSRIKQTNADPTIFNIAFCSALILFSCTGYYSFCDLLIGPFLLFFQVVEHGMFVKHCKVEVYLLELNLCENDNMEKVVTRHFSKADTIGMRFFVTEL